VGTLVNRDELIEVASQAVAEDANTGHVRTLGQEVEVILDMVEPLIRADEREAVKAEYVPVLMEHLRILADLRAKVEALPGLALAGPGLTPYIHRYDVLALLDGDPR
jgi:hypothetical protein